jgi:hypothetical protein
MMQLRQPGRIALVLLVLFFFLALTGLASVAARSCGGPRGGDRAMIVHDAAIVFKDGFLTLHSLERQVQARLLVMGTHALARGFAWLDQVGLADVEILT